MNQRHYFLDWVRICAFFVLILYHTGMYYVTWDWHVKSPFASTALEPFMFLSSPWRLGLLFFVSGVAASFLMRKTGIGAFVRQRSWRLLVPLVFGMLVVVPLQPYYEVVEKVGYAGSYLDFMRLYVSGYHGFCREDCLVLPTWNHLWFVPYLWVYTVLLGCIALAAGDRLDRWGAGLARLLSGWRALALPAALLLAISLALAHRFPTTHALVDDFYNHATYFSLFMAGVLLARQDGFWQQAEGLRWKALGAALLGWAYMAIFVALPEDSVTGQALELARSGFRLMYAICQWCAMVAACGFARRHLNRDSAWRRYLVHAIFPVYILHQTIIVTLAHNMQPLGIAPAVEGPLIAGMTLLLCFGAYEAIRRSAVLRPLFGASAAAAPAARQSVAAKLA